MLVYMVLIFIRIMLKLVPADALQPLARRLHRLRHDVTDPYLNLFRRFLPLVGSARPRSTSVRWWRSSPLIVGGIIVGHHPRAEPRRGRAGARAGATVSVVVAIDQVTKAAGRTGSTRRDVNVVLRARFHQCAEYRRGLRGTGGGGLAVAVLIGLSLALLIGYFVPTATAAWLWLPVGMLLGGALGNLADRARSGRWSTSSTPFAWPAFNVADSCIVSGSSCSSRGGDGAHGGPRPDRRPGDAGTRLDAFLAARLSSVRRHSASSTRAR